MNDKDQNVEKKRNLTGFFSLKESKDLYQMIYASQNVGTFYAVYAKFNVEDGVLKDIDFYIKNYKGFIKYFLKGVKTELDKGVLNIALVITPLRGDEDKNCKVKNCNIKDVKELFLLRKARRVKSNPSEIDRYEDVMDENSKYQEIDIEKELESIMQVMLKQNEGILAAGNNCRTSRMRAAK